MTDEQPEGGPFGGEDQPEPKPKFQRGGMVGQGNPLLGLTGDVTPIAMSDSSKDLIIQTQSREIEIRGQQIKQFQEENQRFREMVDTVNKNCRALQLEVGLVNARAMEVTAALILKGEPTVLEGQDRLIHIKRGLLRTASSGYMLEKVKPGDKDYLDDKKEGDLLLRLRETTEEEKAAIKLAMAKVEKAEAERATPETPKKG